MAAYCTLSASPRVLLSLRSSSSSSSSSPSSRKPSSSSYSKPKNRSRFSSAVLLAAAGAAVVAFAPAALAVLEEPSNALSLPTWAIHVSSVVEWITAMVLVWEYAEESGFEGWKGLSWGMVPLLGGALCACTWHFFYNSESLNVLVALQAGLTVLGNMTMCIAAFRIFKASEGGSKNL